MTRLAFCGFRRASDSEEEDREPRLSGPASLKDADRAVLERAAEIREAPAAPGRPGVRVIAKRFGVNPGTVQRISRPFQHGAVGVLQ